MNENFYAFISSLFGTHLRWNRLRVWVLVVSDTYPMFIEPTITQVPSGFSQVRVACYKNCVEKKNLNKKLYLIFFLSIIESHYWINNISWLSNFHAFIISILQFPLMTSIIEYHFLNWFIFLRFSYIWIWCSAFQDGVRDKKSEERRKREKNHRGIRVEIELI